MRSSTKKALTVLISLIILLFLNIFIIRIKNLYLLSLFLGLNILLVIGLLGYEKNRQRFKKDIIMNIVIYTFLFQILLYIFGIFLGFVQNGYSLKILNIIKNITPVILIILLTEFLRYCINVKIQNNKALLVLSALFFILVDVTLGIHLYDLTDGHKIIEFISLLVLPSISKNILLTFYSLRFGYGSAIIYRLIMEVPVYFLPILPNLNMYVESVLSFLFPIFVFYLSYYSFQKRKEEESLRTKHPVQKAVSIILLVLFTFIIILTSGLFKYYLLSIGSGSMSPNIKTGDAVIVKKVKTDHVSSLKKDDVLVYKYDKKVVVHRITEVIKTEEKIQFRTKGDNNDAEDDWTVNEKDVIGKVILKIPYVGYPTVWLNNLLN